MTIQQEQQYHNSRSLTKQFSSRTWSASLSLAWWPWMDCAVRLCVASLALSPLLRIGARLSLLIRYHGMIYLFLLIPLVLCLWFSCSCCCCQWAWNHISNVAKWRSTKFPNNFYTCSSDSLNKRMTFASGAAFLRSCLLCQDSEFVGLERKMDASEISMYIQKKAIWSSTLNNSMIYAHHEPNHILQVGCLTTEWIKWALGVYRSWEAWKGSSESAIAFPPDAPALWPLLILLGVQRRIRVDRLYHRK